MRLPNRTDNAGLNQFHHPSIIVARVDLRAHLRGDAGLARGLGDDARLMHIAGQRFLAIDVLAHLQRGQGREGVGVLRRADDHGVQILGLVVELPEILVGPRVRILFLGGAEIVRIHIA